MADVSAIISMGYHDILWNLPLADGLWFQREHWLKQGVELVKQAKRRGYRPVHQYFRDER